jgi:hypothetical protein
LFSYYVAAVLCSVSASEYSLRTATVANATVGASRLSVVGVSLMPQGVWLSIKPTMGTAHSKKQGLFSLFGLPFPQN